MEQQEQPTTSQRAIALNQASENRKKWNWISIGKLFETEEKSMKFAEEQGMLPTSKLCPKHRCKMPLYKEGGSLGFYKCQKGGCTGKRMSRAKGTWFENTKLPTQKVLFLTYCFARQTPYDEVQDEDFTESGTTLSTRTIADWFSYCREVIVDDFLEWQEQAPKIGGVGTVVQIDESKFGSRKFHKGRRVDGHWVLGMIQDGSEDLRLEVCDDNVRSAEVLIPLIKKHVLPGTTIHTDFWKAYDCLQEHGFIHKKVNHSDPDNPFVADDGTHTQRIESQWRVVKRSFYQANYSNNFAHWIIEYQWRRKIKKNGQHPFEELLTAIRRTFGDRRN